MSTHNTPIIDTSGNRSTVDQNLSRVEPRVAPVVKAATEKLVEQYHDTLRKLARE